MDEQIYKKNFKRLSHHSFHYLDKLCGAENFEELAYYSQKHQIYSRLKDALFEGYCEQLVRELCNK